MSAQHISPARPAVMLAKQWDGAARFPLLAQPKLDGVRCLASPDGLVSRYGNAFPALDHIAQALADFRTAQPGFADMVFDGEIYAHGWPLERIAGECRRLEPGADTAALEFHIFDFVSDAPARIRLAQLNTIAVHELTKAPLRIVLSSICLTLADADRTMGSAVANGFEGLILRDPAAPYTPGRTAAMLKRKPFDDREGRILRLIYSKTGKVKAARVELDDGRRISAGLGSTLMAHRTPRSLIGRQVTFRHHMGQPQRNARIITIHPEEGRL